MKKLFTIVAFAIGLLTLSTVMAATSQAPTHNDKATTQNNNDFVQLYAKPEKGAVFKKLAPNLRLVPIFQKDNWLKVADPRNGQVGWVNIVQYQNARMAYYRPDIQTIYIHFDENKNGKPVLNVLAYKNGKRLTDKEAMRLYKRIRRQQREEVRDMQHFSLSMYNMMDQDFLNAERFFDSAALNPPWMEPIILVPAPVSPTEQANAPGGPAMASDRN